MNFLAHLYLSGEDPDIRLGNFLGDFVRGRDLAERFPEKIAAGIVLHRRIDEITDAHPVVRMSKLRLRPAHRHYSSVIVDIFYDHFLAAGWANHHHIPLEDYARIFYDHAIRNTNLLPERAAWVLEHMIKGDWITSYREVDGIHRVLCGMARRTRFASGMEVAAEALKADYESFRSEFNTFFPHLKKECGLLPSPVSTHHAE